MSLTPDLGNPKLFIGGAVGRQELSAAALVNNFVAVQSALILGWPGQFIGSYPVAGFSRPGGSGLRLLPRAPQLPERLFYIGVAGSSLRETGKEDKLRSRART